MLLAVAGRRILENAAVLPQELVCFAAGFGRFTSYRRFFPRPPHPVDCRLRPAPPDRKVHRAVGAKGDASQIQRLSLHEDFGLAAVAASFGLEMHGDDAAVGPVENEKR